MPTNGSDMILNANALKGASSSAGLVSSSPVRGSMPTTARDIGRCGQIVDDCVQKHLHALVLEGAAAEHGREFDRERGRPDGRLQAFLRGLAALEIAFHQLFVGVRQRLEQPAASLLGGLDEIVGDGTFRPVDPHVVLVQIGDHAHDVDDAPQGVLLPDRQLDHQRTRAEPVDHGLHRMDEVGPGTIHLVDEGDAGHLVLVGLPPHRLRLRLDARDRVEHGDGAVEDPKRAFHLHSEVHVPGRVYDVHTMLLPLAGGSGRRDGDAALLLLLHPVHHRGAVVHLAHLVGATGVVEDPLGRGGLTGIDVSHDADIPHPIEREQPRLASYRPCWPLLVPLFFSYSLFSLPLRGFRYP